MTGLVIGRWTPWLDDRSGAPRWHQPISERDPIDKSNLASYDWAWIELSLLL